MNMKNGTRHLALRLPHLLAAVEARLNPSLAGRAFAICTSLDARGQLLGVSAEAAARGLRAGLRLGEARRICAEFEALPGDSERARAVSERVGRSLGEIAPAIRRLKPGEFLLDLSGCRRLHPDELALGRRLLTRLETGEGLQAAAGVASSALAAQLIARRAAVGEVHAVAGHDERRLLDAFPLEGLPELSPALLNGLAEAGVRLVGEARRLPAESLLKVWGEGGRLLLQRLAELGGRSRTTLPAAARPPAEGHAEVSVRSRLPVDSVDPALLWGELHDLAERGLRQLRASGRVASQLLLRLDWSDGRSLLRGERLRPRPDETELATLRRTARNLLDSAIEARRLRVVALELRFGGLKADDGQADLFRASAQRKEAQLNSAIEGLRQRFGHGSVRVGLGS